MVLLLLACADEPTDLPVAAGELDPLEDVNQAPQVPAAGADPTPEQVVFVSGHDDEANHYWTHARAWVHADVPEIWAALTELDVMADRRAVDSYALLEEGHREGFDHSFVVENRVQDLVAIQFELTWLHLLTEGEATSPQRVLARWDKTAGTPFIDRLSGSVELIQTEPGLTELSCISHLRATGRDATGMEQYWLDLHGDIVATLRGASLPTY